MQIQENDEDVLEYLTDIRCEDLWGTEGEEDEDEEGFKLSFVFAKNPYFSDKELVSPSSICFPSISSLDLIQCNSELQSMGHC